MVDNSKKIRIKIVRNGPYIISGNIPLSEKIITPKGSKYIYKDGRELPQAEQYALCRCGCSKNHPYCDGTHTKVNFEGEETASREKYVDRARTFIGQGIDLLDDYRCAFARFCHRDDGNAWELVKNSYSPEIIREAIQAASDCPAGRLVAMDKDGNMIEPEYSPSIDVLQDPEKGVSGPLFVKGNIPIESADGTTYEIRNRLTLCRCGHSSNMPFCDASHTQYGFSDKTK